jgi:serine/threonine protein kinase
MGVVLLARDPKLDRLVAIKTYEVGESSNLEEWRWLRERLLAEANRAGSLDHPNIVRVFDVVDEGELAYIVMEYVTGLTLDEYLRTHGFPNLETVLGLLGQTASALDYAHSKGIIHRDIKPGNLMIDDEGRVKITDFGIAIRAGSRTRTGRLLGTPEFMAPEQIEGVLDIDGRADQFALGTLAYILLTGRKPFEADTLASLSHQIVTKHPAPPSVVNPQVHQNVDKVIQKAMSKDRRRRFSTCTEFITALGSALYEERPGRMRGRVGRLLRRIAERVSPSGKNKADLPVADQFSYMRFETQRSVGASTIGRRLDSLADGVAPTGFFEKSAFSETAFFTNDDVRLQHIEGTFSFYRDQLEADYRKLSRQASLTFALWVGCVSLAFVTLVWAFALVVRGGIQEGIVISAGSVLLGFIQRVFSSREDHYRSLADQKSRHLEYGNKWLLTIQTIDSIKNPEDRASVQIKLVDMLTKQLAGQKDTRSASPRKTTKKTS